MTDELDLGAVRTDGWTVVDLLDEQAVASARALIDELALPEDHGFFASPAQAWGLVARSIDRRLKALTARSLTRLVPEHRAFLAGVTSKGRRHGLPIQFHQDWTYTDERLHRPVFLWCALVDTDADNGGLAVVPGSHHWSGRIRPSRSREASEGLQAELAERSLAVSLRAGQAIAFDPGMFHGSGPNHAPEARPAFTIAVVPRGATLVHFHETPDGVLSGYVVDDDFFTMNPYRERPTGYPPFEPFDRALTTEDLELALRTHGRSLTS